MPDKQPTVQEAWSLVMGQVQSIGKTDRNAAQNFNFRGIDATMSAVGPALREHRVFVIPKAKQITTDTYSTRGGAVMRNATVLVEWMVVGPAGDTFTGCTYGEAADAGDKAVSKAHSVAYRTFLLQALCIPTDELDPDASSHERSATPPQQTEPPEPPREQSPADKARSELLAWADGQDPKVNTRDLNAQHIAAHGRGLGDEEDVALIRAYMTEAQAA